MNEERGLYRSFDRWIRKLSRGRYAFLVGVTSAALTYALHPLLSYSRPSIIALALVAVVIGAFGYLIRPFQNDPR